MRPSALLTTLFLPLLTLSSPHILQSHPQQQSSSSESSLVDWHHLSHLLDNIDSTILHTVLHQLSPKFQDGVFSADRSALEHVHSESPAVATKLVHIAIKRQASNSTTTRQSTTSSENTATTSPTPTSAKSTASNQATAITSALSSAIHASTVPSATTVVVPPSAPSGAVPVATKDGGIVYSTLGGGLVTLTSSAVSVHFTPSTSTALYYSTLPDGEVQTSTALVVVNAPVTGVSDTAAQGAAATSSGSPSLQNGADSLNVTNKIGWMIAGVAALGGALLLI